MRRKVVGLVSLFMFCVLIVLGAEKTAKFEVKATEACEAHIEKAAKSVDGVSQAEWDEKTQNLEVVYDDSKTNLDKIEMAVAKDGHDTPKHKAEKKCTKSDAKSKEMPK